MALTLTGVVDLDVAFIVGVVILLVIASVFWHYSRSRSLLQQWADENGFVIVHSEYRSFFKGPYFWTSSKSQTVYYVTVRDRDGNERNGWVRCGGLFLGLLSDRTDVRWDE